MVSAGRVRGTMRVLLTTVAACAFAGWSSPSRGAAHPLHTTITELTFDASTKAVRLSIRVFSDDLAEGIRKRTGVPTAAGDSVTDAAALAYVRATVSLVARDRRPLPLASCGSRSVNDLRVLCILATAPAGPSTLRLRQGMLLEVYDDQVNVVQTLYGGRRRSLLFTRSSPAQALP